MESHYTTESSRSTITYVLKDLQIGLFGGDLNANKTIQNVVIATLVSFLEPFQRNSVRYNIALPFHIITIDIINSKSFQKLIRSEEIKKKIFIEVSSQLLFPLRNFNSNSHAAYLKSQFINYIAQQVFLTLKQRVSNRSLTEAANTTA